MRIFGLTITRRDIEAELKHTEDLLSEMDSDYADMSNRLNDRIAELKRNVQYWKNRALHHKQKGHKQACRKSVEAYLKGKGKNNEPR